MTELPTAAGDWLRASASPGRSALRIAAAFQVLDTVFTALAWIALASLIGGLAADNAGLDRPVLGLLALAGLLAAAAAWGATWFQAVGRSRISGAIRRDLTARLCSAGQADRDAASAATAAVELVDDVAEHHAEALPRQVSAPLSMVVILLATAALQWPTVLVLLLAGAIVVPNLRLAGLFAKEGAEARRSATDRLAAVVLDSFRGMRTLRGLGAVRRRRAALGEAAARLDDATLATVRRAFLSGAMMEVVITYAIAVNATYIGLSLLGYLRIGVVPQVTLASGLATLLLCPMYFTPMREIAAAYHSRERATVAAEALAALLTGTPARHRTAPAPQGPVSVSVNGASVQFEGASEPVLSNVNVTIEAGQWVAVTGASGAGKTTLLSLIAGALSPSSGAVRWHTAEGPVAPQLGGCAWIGQRTVILPGSVADNIGLGRLGADRTRIQRAAADAGLSEVMARLPSGLDTPLGEGGWGLSTGESRRIAIARALICDADLWILDEPTAHLDLESEAALIDVLRVAVRGRTVVAATHSARLARAADALLVVAEGKVLPIREAVAS